MADDLKNTVQQRRRELLHRRIAESGLAALESVAPQRLRVGEHYGLSAGQRRMWFLQNMDPADSTLNICVAFRLTGALDVKRLHAAANDVVARHAILRTTYGVDTEGEPYQVVREDLQIHWQSHDLVDTAECGPPRQVEALAHAEFGRSFDLANELPMRVTLIRAGADEFVLLLVVHHICWDDDGWGVFFGELSAAYNGGLPTGRPPQFVEVEVLDLPAEPSESDVEYWRNTLRPLPEPLELPGAPALLPSRRADRRACALPQDMSGRVEAFAREHSVSPFMVFLAAFGVLVRRYTGAPDFLISVPVAERKAAAAGALGYFGNTLLLRMSPRSHDTFTSFVDAVRDACLGGFAHQSVGIDRVVREANPVRSTGRDGMDQLVRLGFSMRKNANELALDGVSSGQMELGAVTAQLPLSLAVVLDPHGALLEVEYQADVLTDALVDQMLAHYVRLLDHSLRAPGRRITNLDMHCDDDRAAVLAQSHGELVATPATTMVAVLESAAATAPERVAVASDDAVLTYAELHGRANRLARRLIAQGIGPEDIVGLRLTASVEFVVAMLAVLKAGSAYLPIDPAYPDDRIEFLISDSRPGMVIDRHEFEAAESAAAPLSDAAIADGERLRPLRPDHLAYVIYTSGSTGRPKGVAVAHRAIAEHVEGFIAEWTMTAQDRLLQSSSVSFDASLLDIFVTLSLGAQLVIPRPSEVGLFGDLHYVADLVNRHRVTVLHMVPSMLSTLLLLPEVDHLRGLRHVPVGGEALSGEVADRFAARFDAQLRNHYGPTEAVVCSTHRVVEGTQGTGVVPIGVPNRNVYTYVLDEELQPVPAEVVGELYLGGVQLARGYLGRPELTAQRFVADPFNPGMRLYRSGDLVRRNGSGELEFVGRADEQVKIRGFRIELGEVESVIAGHPAVRHCLVLAEDTEVGPILVAYVVPADGDLDLDDVRAHAAAALPEYMVPSAFGVMPEIPLTVSGKLDKRALPAPTPIAASNYRHPATATERRMCAIFARLFGDTHVGAEDSFFALGGHSLLAARLVAQIRAEFGVELTVRSVFDTPTPAALAARLVEQFRAEFDIDLDALDGDEMFDNPRSTPQAGRPELVKAVRPERLPLSYSQLATWFQHRMDGASSTFNLAFAARFDGPLQPAALGSALHDIVARHESLRASFGEHEGVPYQFVNQRMDVELAFRHVAEDAIDDALAELRRQVFTPESGPLIRPTLLAIDPHTHVLVVLVHHIVADHASMSVLFDDLIAAYRSRLHGEQPQWAVLPVQYVDYVLWQRDAFGTSSEWGQAELTHWRTALAGSPDEITVAADRARPTVLGRRGEVVNFTVSAARRGALTRLAEQADATEFMVYQAVLAALLHKLGGGPDIAIGSPVAARVDPACADLVGLFANMVVLRNDVSDDPTLSTLLRRSRDAVLDAFAHQELPIERLVEALNPPRSRSRNPLFQTMINFRGDDWALMPRDLTGGGETTVVPLPMDLDVSFLDLNFGLHVTAEAELDVWVVANADLYQAQTVALIADALDTMLDAFATTPDRRVSAVDVLPKADLEALLAAPAPAAAGPTRALTCGSVETQRTLIVLLEELLDLAGVDAEDNFFALGGDSIISIQWATRAAARGLALTPQMVFEHMTIAELAAAVEAGGGHIVGEGDSVPTAEYAPMSASGLTADALADLTASWHGQS